MNLRFIRRGCSRIISDFQVSTKEARKRHEDPSECVEKPRPGRHMQDYGHAVK
jgi:hypothetical protein